eukprot:1457891-Amphidinium_carterae.2
MFKLHQCFSKQKQIQWHAMRKARPQHPKPKRVLGRGGATNKRPWRHLCHCQSFGIGCWACENVHCRLKRGATVLTIAVQNRLLQAKLTVLVAAVDTGHLLCTRTVPCMLFEPA